MSIHSEAMQRCLRIAFEEKRRLSRLTDEELAVLITLQHTLWWERDLVGYLLSDYEDREEELAKKCRPAINEALRRLSAEGGIIRLPLFAEALFPVPKYFPAYARKIERLFEGYVREMIGKETLTEGEGRALVAVYARLRYLRRTFENPGYEYGEGKEKALGILEGWLASFRSHTGWEGLTLREALGRTRLTGEYDYQAPLDVDMRKAWEIFRHYLSAIDGYPDEEYCQAVALRGADPDRSELPYAEEDFRKTTELLESSKDLTLRLLAARALIAIFHTLYLDEATAALAPLEELITPEPSPLAP